MKIWVNVITETTYTIDIPDIPEEEEDKFYEEFSCQPCMDDIVDVENYLESKGVEYEDYMECTESRIETWT